ncbi:MAG: hypothetical protein ACI9Y1_002098 [Lentisphaeria bacterium]|jgi:hypothetical protein
MTKHSTDKVKVSECELEQLIQKTFDDFVLSPSEKYELKTMTMDCTEQGRRFMVDRSFDVFVIIFWLKKSIKTRL